MRPSTAAWEGPTHGQNSSNRRRPFNTLRSVALGLVAACISACASQPNPIIDTKGVDMAA
jgi:hypothetical protein